MHYRILKSNQSRIRCLNWKKTVKVEADKIIKLYDPYLIGSLYIKENWIYNLVVNPKYRNKVYGSKLLKIAEKEIFKKYNKVMLTPQDNNDSLREFYSKNGYEGYSKDNPYYEEEDKGWWEMWKLR